MALHIYLVFDGMDIACGIEELIERISHEAVCRAPERCWEEWCQFGSEFVRARISLDSSLPNIDAEIGEES